MKKTLIIIVLVLVGAGVYFYFENYQDVPQDVPTYDISQLSKELTEHAESMAAKPKVSFADLMSSIEQEEKIECDYRVVDEETKKPLAAKIYVDGDTYKSIIWKGDDKEYSIFDGEVFWSWSNKTKKGHKMKSSCIEEFESLGEGESDGDFDLDTYKTSKELFDKNVSANCTESPYVNLSVPADVTFVDQCELLKKQREIIKEMKR